MRVPTFTEMVIPTKLEGDRGGGDIVVGRAVVDLEKDYIPVRVGNLSSGRKKLRKGAEIAVCEPVGSITSMSIANEEQGGVSTKEPVPEHLQSLLESSTENLCYRDKKKVAELL